MIRTRGRLVARFLGDSRPAREVTDEQVLGRLIEQMRQGTLPWHRPWSSTFAVRIGSVTYAPGWPANLRAPDTPFGVFNGTKLLTWAAQRSGAMQFLGLPSSR